MKKLSILFTLSFVLGLLLAACDTTDDPGLTPEVTSPGMELTTTPEGDLTEEPAETMDVTESPAAVAELTETPVMTEPVTATGTITATQIATATGEINPGQASNLLDLDIWNRNDEQIGAAEDRLINFDEQKVDYLIADVGGILGIGGKLVPIPYERLELMLDKTGASVGIEPEASFVVDTTRNELESAPELDTSSLPNLGEAPGEYDQPYNDFWQTSSQAITDTNSTFTDTQSSGMMGESELQGVILASDLFNMDVNNTAGDELGDVRDLIIDPESGEIQYLVIDISGIQDIDGQWLLLPVDALRSNTLDDVLEITVTQDAIIGAPVFEPDQLPDTTLAGWDANVRAYWDTQIQ